MNTMRTIKFRAWDGEKWNSGIHLFLSTDGRLWERHPYGTLKQRQLEERNWPIVFFTGLKDKNGKEIYEGDIVTKQGKKPTVITFENNEGYSGGIVMGFAMPSGSVEDMEVIGNIYENPELLKI